MALSFMVASDQKKYENPLQQVLNMRPKGFKLPNPIKKVIPAEVEAVEFWSDVKTVMYGKITTIGLYLVCVLLVFINQGVVLSRIV